MFDIVEIVVKGGNGGDGKVSFRREKFDPFGGPDGGNGGNGGDVLVRAERDVESLLAFRNERLYHAERGGDGQGKQKHGKKGEDLIILVPEGTMIWQKTSGRDNVLLADLEKSGQWILVAKGGQGGLGNTSFASACNQAPQISQSGKVGEENRIVMEYRLIADVGIIGYPNAGKSTLLAQITSARPEIASYPFTTRKPVLGVAEFEYKRYVIAEIPGLVTGSHLGKGIGNEFLRHLSRVRVIIHLIDGTSVSPVEDMTKVNTELELFDMSLTKKPQVVAVNKIDIREVAERLDNIRGSFNAIGIKVRFISAVTDEEVPELMSATRQLLHSVSAGLKEVEEQPLKVFHPQPIDIVHRRSKRELS